MTRMLIPFAVAVFIVMAIGCSGNSATPVAPSPEQQSPSITDNAQVTPPPAEEPGAGHSLLGYWDVYVNEDDMTVEIIPLRTMEYHFNLTKILESGSMGLAIVPPISIDSGVLSVDIQLTHPFTGNDTLSGFDVKGILITEGTKTGFADPDIKIAGPHETRLLNADGFTRWWNPAEFTHLGITGYSPGKLGSYINPDNAAVLNGYKLFADDFAANANMGELDPATRAFFQAGGINTRHYEISLASGLHFNYAIDCSWAEPTVDPPVDLPGDFPLEANQAEPWWISVTESNNTLWYLDGDFGGNVNYEVTIHDWQGMDDIGSLHFESPGVFTFTATEPDEETEFTGTYSFDVVLPTLTSNDPLDVLVTVEVPGDYDSPLTGVTKSLRGYHRHLTPVSNEDPIFNELPVAMMHATSETEIFKDETISFDASASYDIDGYISDYLWDFNGDNVYGDSFDGDPETPTHTYTQTGTFDVKVKVRDNSFGSTISDPVTVQVTLDTNDPPIAVAEATTSTHILEDETVSFDGSASYDLDGTIVNWAWDFDGDGNYTDEFEGDMQTPTATFPDPGTFYVDLMVIDNEDGYGTLETKIEIEVEDIPNVLPTASAEATTPTEIDACGTVSFDASDSTDTDGTLEQYLWDFNADGTFGDTYESGDDLTPTAYFDGDGVWDVQLKVIDDEGGEDILDVPITVTATNVPPVAVAEATTATEITSFETVTFDASASYDPDCEDTLTFEWDFDGDAVFGDPYDSGTDANPTVEYTTPGVYDVNVTVYDAPSGSDVLDTPITVTVNNAPPEACAEITTEYPYWWESNVDFSGECSTDLDGTIIDWEWDLNADDSYEETGETASYYFPNAGQYTMQLRVTDDLGGTDLLDEPLEFWVFDNTNSPPDITAVNHSRTTSQMGNTNESVDLSVDFTDLTPPGDTHTYLWSCDYGSFDDPTSPTPTWDPPNEVVQCDITVKVTDAGGMFDEGTCSQWVTSLAVVNGNSQGMMPSGTIYSFDPADVDVVFPDHVAGSVCYINFWATWCPPCKNELPHLTEVYDHFGGDPEYFHIMSSNESPSTQLNYLNQYDYHATYWCQDPGSAYYSATLHFGNSGYIPWHTLFDRDGRARWVQVGGISSPSTIINKVEELL